jgi:hypothetical protein
MEKLIPSSEVVQSVCGDGGEWEVRADAEANYDESDSHVVLELESFLRKASTSGDGEVRQLRSLPGKSRVSEHALCGEASQAAHDVFASSVRKVHHSIPPLKGSA